MTEQFPERPSFEALQQVPLIYRFNPNLPYQEAIRQDNELLDAQEPPLTHSEVYAALTDITEKTMTIMAASAEGQQIKMDYGDAHQDPFVIADMPIAIDHDDKPWLKVTFSPQHEWHFINLQTGDACQLHNSLLQTINELGFYGAHSNRATPLDIAQTLGLRPNQLPNDHPVTIAWRNVHNLHREPVIVRTFDELQRLKNIEPVLHPAQKDDYAIRPKDLREAELMHQRYGIHYYLDVVEYNYGRHVLRNLP